MLRAASYLVVQFHGHQIEGSTAAGNYDSKTKNLYMAFTAWQAVRETHSPGEIKNMFGMDSRRTLIHESFHAYEDLVLKNRFDYRAMVDASNKYYAKSEGAANADRAREESYAEYVTARANIFATAQDKLEILSGRHQLTAAAYDDVRKDYNSAIATAGRTAFGQYHHDDPRFRSMS
jgi:nucleoside diphosphate kinase